MFWKRFFDKPLWHLLYAYGRHRAYSAGVPGWDYIYRVGAAGSFESFYEPNRSKERPRLIVSLSFRRSCYRIPVAGQVGHSCWISPPRSRLNRS